MTVNAISRRRALTIFAGAAGALALGDLAQGARIHEWHGTALGADAHIAFAGFDPEAVRRTISLVLDEVERLEKVFSLYRAESELVRLNRDSRLDGPSHDLRLLLGRALGYWEATGGAFNPAIQPLWHFYASHFAENPGGEPDANAIMAHLALCDPRLIELGSRSIRLAPGMALTLNGIAQGYITDRVAELLEDVGARDILLGLGELRALPGRAWRVEIADAARTVSLSARAVATSAGKGTPFTHDLEWHHLIDPHSGLAANRFRSVTILAATATEADALSTAVAVSNDRDPQGLIARFDGAELIAVAADGTFVNTRNWAAPRTETPTQSPADGPNPPTRSSPPSSDSARKQPLHNAANFRFR